MYSRPKYIPENTSTPKRRRLGPGSILRPISQVFDTENKLLQVENVRPSSPLTKNDDPPLPCNQIEYLCDSENNSSTSSGIQCSSAVINDSVMGSIEKWQSLNVSTDLKDEVSIISKELNEIEDISDDMFYSRLEQEESQTNHENITLLTSSCEKNLRENIEDTFDAVNQSISSFHDKSNKKSNTSPLFETKDSFLLDIKESGNISEENNIKSNIFPKPNIQIENRVSNNDFYGLPIITKGLFKSCRNIDKFYDWQEECLNLDAIKERRNLIYALPTSGGKTLVAEVLMLREVLNRNKNALFILPFVAIVQEKIWSLSPFAVNLDFLVEEYAAGKGLLPPKKRRKKNSIYIATIEKGLALVRSLIDMNRLDEIGLIVVDELHLIGEPGRGGTLETLLTTVIYANKGIQIVGMSATIGNLAELGVFLRAHVYEREFRPVRLDESVKLGDVLYRLRGGELEVQRQLAYDYSAAATSLDPDWLGGLVSEVVPEGSCLVFCPTKRNCENVAALLCKLQRREMARHRRQERAALAAALLAEGGAGGAALAGCARAGVGAHHAGLGADERALLEHAFRSGVISVLCCTSTLAAGVNLPARRVIIRAPRVGRAFISLAAYRQMAGRAGRAGVCEAGESIIICDGREWPRLRAVLSGGLPPARSVLAPAMPGLLLSAVALRLATTRPALADMLACSLLATAPQDDNSPTDIQAVCDDALRSLISSEALELARRPSGACVVYNDSQLVVSELGRAAIKGCMDLSVAKQLLKDLETASRALVLMGSLHLLYLVTPHDGAGVRPDYRHYYSLYCGLDEEGVQTAKVLGITEQNAIRMVTGKPITNVPERVLVRFYLALMLHDLWKQEPFPAVAEKYCLPRGTVQSIMASSAAFASCAQKMCEELEPLWTFRALLGELASRLQHCAAPELQQLMELPAVKKARAVQLMRAGYKRVEDLAKASVDQLVTSVAHLSRAAANHLISSARMMLIEKVENLRAEAQDVMEELKI